MEPRSEDGQQNEQEDQLPAERQPTPSSELSQALDSPPAAMRSRPSQVAIARRSAIESMISQNISDPSLFQSRASAISSYSPKDSRVSTAEAGASFECAEGEDDLEEDEENETVREAAELLASGGVFAGQLVALFRYQKSQSHAQLQRTQSKTSATSESVHETELEQVQEWLFSSAFERRFRKDSFSKQVLNFAIQEQLAQVLAQQLAKLTSDYSRPKESASGLKSPGKAAGAASTAFLDAARAVWQMGRGSQELKQAARNLREAALESAEDKMKPLLARDFPEAWSGACADFWKQYCKDERKKILPFVEPSAWLSKKKTQGSVSPNNRPTKHVMGYSGSAARHQAYADNGSKGVELPTLGGKQHRIGGAVHEWDLDRHAKSARRTQVAALSQARRRTNAALPGLVQGMQPAVTRVEKNSGQLLQRHSSEPMLRPSSKETSSVLRQSHGGKLPPVLGFAQAFGATRRLPPEPDSRAETATDVYIQACQSSGLLPTPAALEMARVRSILSIADMPTNDDFAAIITMIPLLDRLDCVDLSGCRGLQLDSGLLSSLLQQLHGKPAGTHLKRLDLSGQRHAEPQVISSVSSMLRSPTGPRGLVQLDLSGIAVSSPLLLDLSEAIADHPNLRVLSLASSQLGLHDNVNQAMANVLKAECLASLDLSYNSLTEDTFSRIGEGVCGRPSLRSLSLVACSGSRSESGESPCMAFLEQLAKGGPELKCLDLSANLVDASGTLVLEDSLEQNSRIEKLSLGNNAIGTAGMQSILRLLCRDNCGLVSIDCTNCSIPGEEGGADGGCTDEAANGKNFNLMNSCGRYELDLGTFRDRAVLRQLYKTCQRAGLAPDNAFVAQEFSEGSFSHPTAPGSHVPTFGKLSFTFTLNAALAALKLPANKGKPPAKPNVESGQQFLQDSAGLLRFIPGQKKAPILLVKWMSSGNAEDISEQLLLLDALSRGFQFDYPLFSRLVASADYCSEEVLCRLMHTATITPAQKLLSMNMAKDINARLRLHKACQNVLSLDPEAPTGRYKLQLKNPADYAVAESLLWLERWESAVAQKDGRGDLSVHGNWCNIRNCSHGGTHLQQLPEWHLHDWGVLTFDYVTWRRPPAQSKTMVLARHAWQKLLRALVHLSALYPRRDQGDQSGGRKHSRLKAITAVAGVLAANRLKALRSVASRLVLSCWQLRELLNIFGESRQRVDCLVFLYLRLADPENSKLLFSRVQDKAELEALSNRIGTMVTMPFYQPERSVFHLDLSLYQDRLATTQLLRLAIAERIENIKEESLTFPDQTNFHFESGIPRQWADEKLQPQSGIFSFKYICSPDVANFSLRKELAKTYAGWRTEAKAEQVLRWTSISEVPPELRDFVFVCMKQLSNPDAIWKKINVKGQGNISLAEFRNGMEAFGLKKYIEDQELTKKLFRQLDPDTNGEVSPKEWDAITQLYRDIRLCLLEFLQHIDRIFLGDFERAWVELDENDDGVIEVREWKEAVVSTGYYGPAMLIFNLAATDSKLISHADWLALLDFWQVRANFLQETFGTS